MKKSALLLAALAITPLFATNYVALTISPKTPGMVVTLNYTMYLTIYNVLTLSHTGSRVVTLPPTPITITKTITVTPTLPIAVTAEGALYMTAVGKDNSTVSTSTTYTLALEPGKTNSVVVSMELGDYASVEAEVSMFVASPHIAGVALAAVAVGLAKKLHKRSKA